ncbi:nucleoredoxin-like [Pollicipes pollicipes]|nr:nucleoredoxin-like [Pollicipes pollicipes]
MRCLFKIQDIPCLSLVDMASGQTIISNACDLVREHPDGRGFPWRPRSYEQLMVDGLLDKDGQLCDYSRIQGAFKALYFAANWCPPCKAFTPELREMAGRICSRGLKFEVILVSSDRTAESFEQHRGAAPWLAVPYAQAGRRRELAERFGVQGIPSLLVLDQHDRLVCRNARAHVAEDPLAQAFPWQPALVQELAESHRHLLDEPLLVLFVDAEPEEVRFAREVLTPAAEATQKYRTDQADLIRFFIGTESEVAEQVRETAGVDDAVPQLVIIDLSLGHRFGLEEGVALTPDRVAEFVERWRRRQLEPTLFDTP